MLNFINDEEAYEVFRGYANALLLLDIITVNDYFYICSAYPVDFDWPATLPPNR